ncbi:sensor histidine kinase [Halobacillus campisalis]|uniref:histidine kinase n=1 Tax=Halobacillus campisalis TaxID=435909 RepID=A0ABW2K9B4_9BACI|nr:ATP-binding protein [Halobacillus campisalis]
MELNKFLPSRLWMKLTIINVSLLILLVLFTGLIIYDTACYLASNLVGMGSQTQFSFNSSLLSFSLLVSVIVILFGGVLYAVITKRMLRPVKELTHAMELFKSGHYPKPISPKSHDEISELVQHFNHLIVLLQEQEKNRNQMLSDLSHELRTPLSNLRGYLEALEKGVLAGDRDIYKSLAEETERVTGLVQQLDTVKEWDRSSTDRVFSKESVQVDELVNQVIRLFELEFERVKIQIDTNLEEKEMMIHREGIQQVLTNLLNNMIEYRSEDTSLIQINGQLQEGYYYISIAGKGQYIPVENKEKVFERLYRVDPSRSRVIGGSGLGLSISKEIIEHHGGEIWLETDGYNHIFHLTIPTNSGL